MTLSVFDLHCDTALEMYRAGSGFSDNDCHLSARLLQPFSRFGQVAAVFCPQALTDEEGWQQCFRVLSHLRTHLDGCAGILSGGGEIASVWGQGKTALLPAVEDGRILAGKPERLPELYRAGGRVLTLLWGGNTCIGGSHDTGDGLTDFGKRTVSACFDLGIIPDVSHASEQSTEEIIGISREVGKPCIASHSDSYAVHPHSRNLHDRHFTAIRDLGGVVGLTLCPAHLGGTSYEKILDHAEHYLSLGGEKTLCLGCDLDGTELPDGIRNVSDLTKIADLFARHGYSDDLIERIFYRNAVEFFVKNLTD